MRVSLTRQSLRTDRAGLVAVLVTKEDRVPRTLPHELKDTVSAPVDAGDFSGAVLETRLLYQGKRRVALIGLGEKDAVTAETFRRAAAAAVGQARACKLPSLSVAVTGLGAANAEEAGTAVAEGLRLGGYCFQGAKTSKPDAPEVRSARVYLGGRAGAAFSRGLRRGLDAAEAQCLARDLGNQPGNVATPATLARVARGIARNGKLRCRILRKAELERRGFGGLLAVNQGSKEPPVFIELEYRPARPRRSVCLVGKGLTFDTGGISIKPAASMEDMKFDMCGGAVVLGTMQAVARLRPPVRVWGLVPSTDNMPGGAAIKPGDVLKTYGGISVEVTNTDAEGRLILADALGRAQELKADYTIDLATLTGACVVALGHRAAGLFCDDDEFARRLVRAGEASHERLWRLPLWEEYLDDLKSMVADVKNAGSRWGGACTAAAFLKKFSGPLQWAHLDIAGTAWDMPNTEYYKGGATGFGVRALVRFIEELSKS